MDEPWIAGALQQARVARLGTVGVDGAVRLVPVCFAIVDSWVVSAVDHKPKRTDQLGLDDMETATTATVLVDHYDDDWSRLWWVRIRGRAVVHRNRDDDEAVADVAALAAKYPPSIASARRWALSIGSRWTRSGRGASPDDR